MPVFLIRDKNGNVILDLTKSVTKTLGYFTVEPSSTKTVTVSDLFGGKLWVSVSPEQIQLDIGVWSTPPSVVISGKQITVTTVRDVRCFCVYGIC